MLLVVFNVSVSQYLLHTFLLYCLWACACAWAGLADRPMDEMAVLGMERMRKRKSRGKSFVRRAARRPHLSEIESAVCVGGGAGLGRGEA